MLALLDGDVALYEVGHSCQGIDPESGELVISSFDHAKERMDLVISQILRGAKANDVVVYLTGKDNFRINIAKRKGYKAQRIAEKPFHYYNLKAYLIHEYKAIVCEGFEADDAVCIKQLEIAKEFGVAVPFNGGRFLLDYEDWLKYGHITFHKDNKGYIVNDTGKGDTRNVWSLHRELMGNPEGLVVDHINGDPLDNRRYNLRVCSVKENIRNSKPQEGTSKYKGVSWDKDRNKWSAGIKVDKKAISLGRFDEEDEAAKAYDAAALKYFGEYARLNLTPPYTAPFEESIICSRDKDVKQMGLLHYSWECGKQAEWGPYFVKGFGELFPSYYPEGHKLAGQMKKLLGVGDKWFYAQLLMGDSVDNIPGIKGYGPAKVFKLLEDTRNADEARDVAIEAYIKAYGLDDWHRELEEQAQLVWMVRERNPDGSLKMWRL